MQCSDLYSSLGAVNVFFSVCRCLSDESPDVLNFSFSFPPPGRALIFIRVERASYGYPLEIPQCTGQTKLSDRA
jgi:hypothetical protein